MLIKAGVDIAKLNPKIRKSLSIVDKIIRKEGIETVVTSTYEGNHRAGSLHYSNDAYDIRSVELNEKIVIDIKKALGYNFDVVLEAVHIHIEYDPK